MGKRAKKQSLQSQRTHGQSSVTSAGSGASPGVTAKAAPDAIQEVASDNREEEKTLTGESSRSTQDTCITDATSDSLADAPSRVKCRHAKGLDTKKLERVLKKKAPSSCDRCHEDSRGNPKLAANSLELRLNINSPEDAAALPFAVEAKCSQDSDGDLWVCLTCGRGFCYSSVDLSEQKPKVEQESSTDESSRHPHARQHHNQLKSHSLFLSLSTMTVWCFRCFEILRPRSHRPHASKEASMITSTSSIEGTGTPNVVVTSTSTANIDDASICTSTINIDGSSITDSTSTSTSMSASTFNTELKNSAELSEDNGGQESSVPDTDTSDLHAAIGMDVLIQCVTMVESNLKTSLSQVAAAAAAAVEKSAKKSEKPLSSSSGRTGTKDKAAAVTNQGRLSQDTSAAGREHKGSEKGNGDVS